MATEGDGALEVVRPNFRVRVDPSGPWFHVDLSSFSQPLHASISIDTLTDSDRVIAQSFDGLSRCSGGERFTWIAKTTLWQKRYHLDIFASHIEFSAEVVGDGDVDTMRFFDAVDDSGFRPHFALTKHFNDKGRTDIREYAKGSPPQFRHVFCPEPNSHARQTIQPWEYGQISVNADLDYFGGNFIANPGLLCFAAGADTAREWLSFGLAVDPGEYLFSEYEYLGGEEFALRLNSWGSRRIDGSLRTPRMVMVPGTSAEDAVTRYVEILKAAGLVSRADRPQAAWWNRPIVSGWGHQCYQADLFRIRSTAERPPDNAAYTLSTQATYREIVEILDSHALPWGTLVIDARWFQAGGLKNVDVGRWPNLRGFIDEQHRRGRKVLLWWGPWDPDGIPVDQCILYQPVGDRQNRPGRQAKFGQPVPGKKLAIDITIPAVRARIREQILHLLGPQGCDADGLKIDHLSAVPGIYGMAFPDESGRLFGIEAVRACMELVYRTAKEVKQDALVLGQSPNPYLTDVQDMLRLGDIYAQHPESVLAEMTFRAKMARIADPNLLIDTDGWPLPSLQAWREYTDAQPTLGVPSLYYATHLDTTGEAFARDDYARIRRAWS